MLNAGVFDELQGARSLLLWGDEAAMRELLASLRALRRGRQAELVVDGGEARLTISVVAERGQWSRLRQANDGPRWECSAAIVEDVEFLVAPLVSQPGHQYLDCRGLAEQVVISRDEYPTDLS